MRFFADNADYYAAVRKQPERKVMPTSPICNKTSAISRGDLSAWLAERQENCLRLAAQKNDAEKDGWLEDAAYFEAAILELTDAWKAQ